MPVRKSPPTRTLRAHPDLAQLKRQAKELLQAFDAGDAATIAEVNAHYRGARPSEASTRPAPAVASASASASSFASSPAFALHDAQLVLARAYGFDSWPKLKAYVDGVTVSRLVEAVRAGDLATVTAMLTTRPELIDMDVSEHDEHRALHHAVLQRQPEIVRLLMQRGADAHKGIWPHRDATSPLTLAIERNDTLLVDIIREEEARRREAPAASPAPPGSAASASSTVPTVPSVPAASTTSSASTASTTPAISAGSERTARSAVAGGDAEWLRARHARGALTNDPAAATLLTFAVVSNRPDMVTLLLELGFDPDERDRVAGLDEVILSWGAPLRQSAMAGNLAIAEILLAHGANPNTNVYAASTALSEAHTRKDADMERLLDAHGAFHNATFVGYLGPTDRARQLLDDEAAGRLREGMVSPGTTVAESMFEGAADTGNVELLRLVLEHIDWPAGHGRWQGMLMRPFGRHAPEDRERFVTCFAMILDRSGVDLTPRFGRTILHDVAAAWPRTSEMGPEESVAFATILLDRGARVDVRDDLLKSTPLGWACRWGRPELAALLLERGADPIEADAEPWATPRAWAERKGHTDVLAVLDAHAS